MIRHRISLACCAAFLLTVSGFVTGADEKPAAAPAATEEGWIELFNGKDLTGWKASEGVEWKVDDGTIWTPPQRSHLFTDQEFQNFVFKADVMTTPGSNSGIYVHTKLDPAPEKPAYFWPQMGYETQVNVTHKDPVKTGSLYSVVKLYETPAQDDKWWTQEITVKGKNIVVRIDGKIVMDFTEPEGVTGPRKLGRGSFALQAHDPKSVVRYKNIKVKPLPDNPAPKESSVKVDAQIKVEVQPKK